MSVCDEGWIGSGNAAPWCPMLLNRFTASGKICKLPHQKVEPDSCPHAPAIKAVVADKDKVLVPAMKEYVGLYADLEWALAVSTIGKDPEAVVEKTDLGLAVIPQEVLDLAATWLRMGLEHKDIEVEEQP